ncbi:alpha-tubulin suppressor-like RCC1 family protein [Microbacterium testaceum]|uniref:ricin-type beta-trefoil lectin domain protein n=1 Tax=Microbacterium testaceum TaxID=2033 RepID=UPI00278541BC|nr:ricin-type beta-trefoil lectin domain protein [Microbacterium testaceum]MDQ1113627.1 alpha-tubulin suppressor-like RCC1 family protein [Microbacterium testaceum]
MTRSRSLTASASPRTWRRVALVLTAVAAVLGVGFVAPAGDTGAWFTAKQSQGDNSVSAASLGAVSGLSATSRDDGVNARWVDAQQQNWATANSVSSGVSYAVTRTIDGKNATTVYSGSGTTASDPYPLAKTWQTQSTFSVGGNVAGAIDHGTLYTWGWEDHYGALGTNTTLNKYPMKVTVPGDRTIVNFSYSLSSAAAVAADGTVWIWGYRSGSATPRLFSAPTSTKIVSATYDGFTVRMLDANGVVWRGPVDGSLTALSLPGGRQVVQLTKGAMVLASDGTVWSVGGNASNQYGQLANGTFDPSVDPVQAILPAGTAAVKISSYSDNTAILLNNNTVWTAGSNRRGQLGAARPVGRDSSYAYLQKFQVPADKTWTNISVGYDTIGAIASDGTIYMAGWGEQGALGNGSKVDSNVPVKTYNPDRVSYKVLELSSGSVQSYAVDQNGTFWAWGGNLPSTPVFGNGDAQYSTYPYPVIAATGLTYQDGGATFTTCDDGGTPNSAGYCPFLGRVTYAVSYQYLAWSAPSASVTAASTPAQTGAAVVGGPGSSGMCLTIQGNSSDQGTPVVLAACDSSSSGQKWSTWSDGTFRANGKCLDMKGNTPGSVVQLWECNGLGYQWWVPRDDGSMYNPSSKLCLSDPSRKATAGTQQRIDTCDGSPSQTWKLT